MMMVYQGNKNRMPDRPFRRSRVRIHLSRSNKAEGWTEMILALVGIVFLACMLLFPLLALDFQAMYPVWKGGVWINNPCPNNNNQEQSSEMPDLTSHNPTTSPTYQEVSQVSVTVIPSQPPTTTGTSSTQEEMNLLSVPMSTTPSPTTANTPTIHQEISQPHVPLIISATSTSQVTQKLLTDQILSTKTDSGTKENFAPLLIQPRIDGQVSVTPPKDN